MVGLKQWIYCWNLNFHYGKSNFQFSKVLNYVANFPNSSSLGNKSDSQGPQHMERGEGVIRGYLGHPGTPTHGEGWGVHQGLLGLARDPNTWRGGSSGVHQGLLGLARYPSTWRGGSSGVTWVRQWPQHMEGGSGVTWVSQGPHHMGGGRSGVTWVNQGPQYMRGGGLLG